MVVDKPKVQQTTWRAEKVEEPKKVEQPAKRKQEIKKGGISALGPNER